jgi:mono/diheme cytochrome c family protein
VRASGRTAGGAAQALAPAVLAIAAGLGLAASGAPQEAGSPEAGGSEAGAAARVERGQYLVHHVAMCIQCHTPRDEDGALVEAELLTGGTIPMLAPYEGLEWALRAPPLAGLPGGWSADDLAGFLETGRSPSDRTARAPMPPFRMSADDARAVAAYLKSLGG